MGDIKKIRKKYQKPSHPWRIERITEENQVCKEYGIPQKTELWKVISLLESFKNQAKKFSALTTSQAEKEQKSLISKLQSLKLIEEDSLNAILSITVKNVLDRRLQTLVFKKGYAKSMKQARQLIVHRHILVAGKLNTSPSYLVRVVQEGAIEISAKSPFYDTNHPERAKEASKRAVKKQERPKYGFRGRQQGRGRRQ